MNTRMNLRLPLFLLITIGLTWACSGKKEHSESASSETTWAAMDAYHLIMAEAYHPLKDSANLAPAKANAEALAEEAEKWAASTFPERVNTDEMMTRVENLKASTRAFADKVKAGASDEELSTALTALHEEFHHIMEAWEGGHSEHH
ncbi:MAG: hypothetical protein JNL40_02900 [Cyclobacteriaceae bacterium]|nr:hypothetical protein [Cyclobacteriaceae bacterium]